MKRRADPDHYEELKKVLTLAQAVREYPICRKALTVAIDLEKVAAVRQGRNILISRRSLETYIYPSR